MGGKNKITKEKGRIDPLAREHLVQEVNNQVHLYYVAKPRTRDLPKLMVSHGE